MKKLFTFLFAFAAAIVANADPLYTATGTVTTDLEGWGEAVEVEVNEDYAVIKNWAGVEGYDLCVMYDEGDLTNTSVQGVAAIINGEIQDEAFSGGYYTVQTGREDTPKITIYAPNPSQYILFETDVDAKTGSLYIYYVGKNLSYECSWGEDNEPHEIIPVTPYVAEGTVIDDDWGEGYACAFAGTKVKVEAVNDSTVILHNWAGTEGYDLKLTFDPTINVNSSSCYGNVTAISAIVNGVEQQSLFYEKEETDEDGNPVTYQYCDFATGDSQYGVASTSFNYDGTIYWTFVELDNNTNSGSITISAYFADSEYENFSDANYYYLEWENGVEKTEEPTLMGDVDGDGEVTMSDANAVVNTYLGMDVEGFNAEAADMDGDGSVTMSDANAIVNIYLGVEVAQ